MDYPQITLIALWALGLGVVTVKNGQKTTHDIWNSLISLAITVSILYWGGFWS